MIDTILLDLDDVLNAFTMHILGQLGVDVRPYDFDRFPRECGFDMIAAWVKMTGRPKPSIPEFWSWVDRGMWASCPKSEQWWLLDAAGELVGRENVLIATSPTKCSDCVAGKHDWIMRHMPVWVQRQYFITPRKHFLARPGVLLIDDADGNCEKFESRGGATITMPRPWNGAWHETVDCDAHLCCELQELFPEAVI